MIWTLVQGLAEIVGVVFIAFLLSEWENLRPGVQWELWKRRRDRAPEEDDS